MRGTGGERDHGMRGLGQIVIEWGFPMIMLYVYYTPGIRIDEG